MLRMVTANNALDQAGNHCKGISMIGPTEDSSIRHKGWSKAFSKVFPGSSTIGIREGRKMTCPYVKPKRLDVKDAIEIMYIVLVFTNLAFNGS
jgi:hypothetical protein